jgi:hypothetical protein
MLLIIMVWLTVGLAKTKLTGTLEIKRIEPFIIMVWNVISLVTRKLLQTPGAKQLWRNQFSKWYRDQPTNRPMDQPT